MLTRMDCFLIILQHTPSDNVGPWTDKLWFWSPVSMPEVSRAALYTSQHLNLECGNLSSACRVTAVKHDILGITSLTVRPAREQLDWKHRKRCQQALDGGWRRDSIRPSGLGVFLYTCKCELDYFPHSSSERTLRVNLLSAIASGSQSLAAISTLHPYNPALFKWKTVCQMLVVCFIKPPCLWIHLAGSRSRMRRRHKKIKQKNNQILRHVSKLDLN